jgi:hypothetical protein
VAKKSKITEKEIEYLAQQCLDLHEQQDGGGYAFSIDLLLKDLSPEEVKAVAHASVTIAGRKN